MKEYDIAMSLFTQSIAGQAILGCWAIFLLFWAFMAFNVKRTTRQEPWLQKLLMGLGVLLGYVLIAESGARLPESLGTVLVPQTPVSAIVAVLTAVAGLVVMLWARVSLGRNWSAKVVLKERHELIESGPYAYVRHPIYSGLLLLSLGTAVLSGRSGALLGFLVLALVFFLRSRQEERLLSGHFPDAYPRYRARVKGMIPFVW